MHTNIRQHGASVILRHPFQCTRTIWIWIAFVISHDFLWHFVATTHSVFVFDRLPEPVFLVLEPQTHLLNRVRVAYVCIWIFMHIAIAVVVFCWATVALLLKPDSLAGLWAGVLRRSSMDCKCKGRDGKSTETYWTPPVFDFLQHWFPSEVQRREQRVMCFCSLFGTNFRYFNPDFSSILTRVHSPFCLFWKPLFIFHWQIQDPGNSGNHCWILVSLALQAVWNFWILPKRLQRVKTGYWKVLHGQSDAQLWKCARSTVRHRMSQ